MSYSDRASSCLRPRISRKPLRRPQLLDDRLLKRERIEVPIDAPATEPAQRPAQYMPSVAESMALVELETLHALPLLWRDPLRAAAPDVIKISPGFERIRQDIALAQQIVGDWIARVGLVIKESIFALADDDGIDRRLGKALFREERGMPAAPHNRQVGPGLFDRASHMQGVTDRRAGEDGDAEVDRAIVDMRPECSDRVRLQPAIHDDHVILRAIERRADGDEGEWHRPEYGFRVVEDDCAAH